MKTLLKEPLAHFLLIGAALFVAYGLIHRGESGNEHIVVTQGRIESLATVFARTWQRPPTADELDGLIRDYVCEQVYVHEAIALGLDKDDTIINRRLRQKLEFVSEDVVAQTEPTDEELRAFLQAHAEGFRTERRLTFRQVYLGSAQVFLERDFEAAPLSEVAKHFGRKFAASLDALPVGKWQGPIESGYGMHRVFLRERIEGSLPELAVVRAVVRREWLNAQRSEANEKLYQALFERYTVTIEGPYAAAGSSQRLAEAR